MITAVVIGMDSDCYSVEKSQRQNTKSKYKAEYAEFLFKTALPFRDGQFDAILTDLPFGQKFVCQSADVRGTEMDIALFYERICRESLRKLEQQRNQPRSTHILPSDKKPPPIVFTAL
uniref:Uncharacterized protein n=1 Tax=Romanomermis culicivorax TaxID=13658 RepID=A0A915HLX2_ROMCU